MKRSRIGIRRRQKKTNIIIVLLFLFILPVMAVIIGSKITEWWVVPTINTDDILKSSEETVSEGDKTENKTQEETNGTDHEAVEKEPGGKAVDLNSMSIYMIQVASISDNKNIESLVEDLNNHNLPHITYKSNGTYKIYTFASTNREDMENKIDSIREIYEDAYIGQMHIPQKQVQYSDKENKGTEEIIENMNSLLELLEQSSNNLYGTDNEETRLNEYKGVLEKHQKLLNQMLEKLENTDLPKDFVSTEDIKKMVEYQEKNITESLKIIEKKEEPHELQSYFLDNLFRTIEVIKR